MSYLTLLCFQTNAEYRRCVNYPSDKALEMDSSQMDVLRHNHRHMEKQHSVAMTLYKKEFESCIDVREDIAMVKRCLQEKLGSGPATRQLQASPSSGGNEDTSLVDVYS